MFELSSIPQALKTCADEVSPKVQAGKTRADELSPIAQALKTCADELSPIAQALEACADELPSIAQAGGNMCSSCSSYSSFWARRASSCSSYISPWANMCRWAILYCSSFENMRRWANLVQLKPGEHVQLMQLTQLNSELPSKRVSSSYGELICPRCVVVWPCHYGEGCKIIVIVNSIIVYNCKADAAYVRLSSDKLRKNGGRGNHCTR